MIIFLTILALIVVAAAIFGPIIYNAYRKRYRELKDYERALKMVPLLIHLPPPSEDTEVGGRDVRDVTDENISKATVIYNIIASTLQKGFKSRFYGQRHFGFEIIGSQGFVYFYAAVPVTLADVVKQAVISAYPTARLEEATEHNIFSQVGKLSGTVGGELVLKNDFAYPIATYQDLKRDAMQSLLNSLSTLEKEDGAGIQILMRPADPGWRKEASTLAGNKRKGKDKKSGAEAAWQFVKMFVMAASKPPEEKGGDKDKPKELSALEQSVFDSIDEKTRHPGYEVTIRLVASSNVSTRAQAILNNIVATFALFDAPGKNGFKFNAAKDVDALVTGYIMRFFPDQKKKNILNAVELASVFHFPDQRSIPTTQLTRQMSKQVDAPRNMPDDGLLLGYNLFRGAKKPIRLSLGDRQRHMYAVGQTGTGKSTFLENLAIQDMINGDGFAFIDPHGDTAEKLLSLVPKERTEDVIYFSPADMDYPMGLNLFEYSDVDQKDFLIQETLNMLQKLYDPTHQGIMGPRYEHIFRNAALAVMADPNGGTFVDIPKLFRDPQFLKQKLQHVTDQTVLDFWLKEYPASQRSNDAGEVTAWFVSKFGAFLSNAMMRNIIGQTKSAFDLREIMDNKKILLVNLSKGRTGDLNSKLLGMIFVMKFQAAAMSRANIPESERQDFCLYVDEFQNFSTDSFATIMSEARKYHLNLIVANQFTTQLTPEIRDAVFGNMGTVVSFRIGQQDVESLAKYFQPAFDDSDLLRIPSYNAIMRTLVGGVPTPPFSMSTLPPLGDPNPKLAGILKQLSAAKYGHPKAEVEKEIFARMAVQPSPVPGMGGGFGQPGGMPGGGSMGMPAGAGYGAQQGAGYGTGGAGAPGGMPGQPAAQTGWGSAGVMATPGGVAAGGASPPRPAAAVGSPSVTPQYAPQASGVSPGLAPARQSSQPTQMQRPPQTSFLDDWLSTRSMAPPSHRPQSIGQLPAAPVAQADSRPASSVHAPTLSAVIAPDPNAPRPASGSAAPSSAEQSTVADQAARPESIPRTAAMPISTDNSVEPTTEQSGAEAQALPEIKDNPDLVIKRAKDKEPSKQTVDVAAGDILPEHMKKKPEKVDGAQVEAIVNAATQPTGDTIEIDENGTLISKQAADG